VDEVLGEDTVEMWIGEFTVQSKLAAHGRKAYKISELPDYLLWATHREKEALKRHNLN
jgi:hypothetical protein